MALWRGSAQDCIYSYCSEVWAETPWLTVGSPSEIGWMRPFAVEIGVMGLKNGLE